MVLGPRPPVGGEGHDLPRPRDDPQPAQVPRDQARASFPGQQTQSSPTSGQFVQENGN